MKSKKKENTENFRDRLQKLKEASEINAREAYIKAVDYYRFITANPQANPSLEEIELSDNKWSVTLGFSIYNSVIMTQKEYKVITLDAKTGKILSMRIGKI